MPGDRQQAFRSVGGELRMGDDHLVHEGDHVVIGDDRPVDVVPLSLDLPPAIEEKAAAEAATGEVRVVVDVVLLENDRLAAAGPPDVACGDTSRVDERPSMAPQLV